MESELKKGKKKKSRKEGRKPKRRREESPGPSAKRKRHISAAAAAVEDGDGGGRASRWGPLSLLPMELLEMIVMHGDRRSGARLLQTCKFMRNTLRDARLFCPRTYDIWLRMTDSVFKSFMLASARCLALRELAITNVSEWVCSPDSKFSDKIERILRKCPHLETIKIGPCSDSALGFILRHARHYSSCLRDLSIEMSLYVSISTESWQEIAACTGLRRLMFRGHLEPTDNFARLRTLSKLEELCVPDAMPILPSQFEAVAQAMKLRILDISECQWVDGVITGVIAKFWGESLTTLDMSGCLDVKMADMCTLIKACKNLAILSIADNYWVDDRTLTMLADHGAALRTVNITNCRVSITGAREFANRLAALTTLTTKHVTYTGSLLQDLRAGKLRDSILCDDSDQSVQSDPESDAGSAANTNYDFFSSDPEDDWDGDPEDD